MRGWSKELIATAGIILGLFALFQFDSILRGSILRGVALDQVFIIQSLVFIVIVFFAYQTRALGRGTRDGRSNLQEGVLGALVGGLNGYLIWGSLWYFMDINSYPLAPAIVAPSANSSSAIAINYLPLVILGGGAEGSGDLLAVAVIVLFLFVLVVI